MLSHTRRFVTAAIVLAAVTTPVFAQRMSEPVAAHRPVAAASYVPLEIPADRAEGGFARSGFAQFMSSPAGRVLRVVAGAGMIAGGVAIHDDSKAGGTALGVAGLLPLSAGLFDVCYISPLFGGPFSGKAIRAAGK
jgi:hypothetical protein